MNYLAHLTLSHFSAELQVGNYLADMVKGRAATELPPAIYRGVLMHRAIDRLTDSDAGVRSVNLLLSLRHGRYAPVISDVAFDYHLYANWSSVGPTISYAAFTRQTYARLLAALPDMPPRVRGYAVDMTEGDWLQLYTDREGLRQVFSRMLRRLSKPDLLQGVNESLVQYEAELNQAFLGLFPRLNQLADTYRDPPAPTDRSAP